MKMYCSNGNIGKKKTNNLRKYDEANMMGQTQFVSNSKHTHTHET